MSIGTKGLSTINKSLSNKATIININVQMKHSYPILNAQFEDFIIALGISFASREPNMGQSDELYS